MAVGRRSAVVAVVLVVLVVLAVPASAATATVTVSSHSTDTDFNNAQTLDNVTVSGSGSSATVEVNNTQQRWAAGVGESSGTVYSISTGGQYAYTGDSYGDVDQTRLSDGVQTRSVDGSAEPFDGAPFGVAAGGGSAFVGYTNGGDDIGYLGSYSETDFSTAEWSVERHSWSIYELDYQENNSFAESQRVYAATWNSSDSHGGVFAYDATDGTQIWNADDPRLTLSANRTSSVVAGDGMVFTGTQNGEIYALDASDGSVLWGQDAHTGFIWRLDYNETTNTLYSAGSSDNSARAWDVTQSGATSKWAYTAPTAGVRDVLNVGGYTFVTSQDDQTAKLDASDGSVVWDETIVLGSKNKDSIYDAGREMLGYSLGYDSGELLVGTDEHGTLINWDLAPENEYLGQAHTYDGYVDQGFVDLTLSDGSANIVWEGHDGSSWTQVASDTVSSTGNHTQTIGADYQQWRVSVSFSTTGLGTGGEINTEGIQTVVYSPSADNSTASPSAGETSRFAQNQLSIDVTDGDFPTTDGDTVTVDWYVDGVNVASDPITSNQTVTHTTSSLSDGSHTWHVELTDSYSLTGQSDTFTYEVQHFDPVIDNSSASPTGGLNSFQNTYTIDVTDGDFPNDGDTLTAELFIDGSSEGTDTLNSNGTASVAATTNTAGSHTYNWTVTDSYSLSTTSEDFTVDVPGELGIYNETAPQTKISGEGTITVRSFEEDVVISNTTSDGDIDMTDFPVGQEFVVKVSLDGYHDTTVIFDDIHQQQKIWLLNESIDSNQARFTLTDNTGTFQDDPKLLIERPLNHTGDNTTWEVIRADNFGAAGFTTDLETDTRYRLTVESEDGAQRSVGPYTTSIDETVPLTVGTGSLNLSTGADSYTFNATYENVTGTEQIRWGYADPAGDTSSLTVTIYEYQNASNQIYSQTFSDPTDLIGTQVLTGDQPNKSWTVEWSATRNGETIGGQKTVGRFINEQAPALPAWLQEAVAIIVLMLTAGAFSQRNFAAGAVVVALMGGVFWMGGWLTGVTSGAGIAGALFLGVLYKWARDVR